MRFITCLLLSALLCNACNKDNEPTPTPNPPNPPGPPPPDSTLTVDSTILHLSSSSLATTNSFSIKYVSGWSVTINPADTTWLSLSAVSGTGNKQIIVKAKTIHTGAAKRTAIISITSDRATPQTRQLEIVQESFVYSGWSRKYGGNQREYFKGVVATTDSGYIAFGYTRSTNGDVTQAFGDDDLWLVKVDAAGNLIWQRSYGGPGQEFPWQMMATDGGYLIAASTNSVGIAQQPGLHSPWLIKINKSGEIIWQQILDRESMGIIGIAEIPTGYVIVGQTSDISITEENGVMIKVDKSGQFLWERTFGGTKADVFSHVAAAADGGILALGNRNFENVNGNNPNNTFDLWVVKTDADGNFEWEKAVGGSGSELASSITTTSDGGWIVAGWGESADVAGYHGMNDVLLAKIAANGNIQWIKSYGGSAEEIAPNIGPAGNGEYMIATTSQSNDGDISGRVGDIWLFKINAAGDIIWNRSANEIGMNYLFMVSPGVDNRYIVAGGALDDTWLYSFTDQ